MFSYVLESHNRSSRETVSSRARSFFLRAKKSFFARGGKSLRAGAILSRAKDEILRADSTLLSRERNLFSRREILSRAEKSFFARGDLFSREISRCRAKFHNFRARFHDFRAKSLDS